MRGKSTKLKAIYHLNGGGPLHVNFRLDLSKLVILSLYMALLWQYYGNERSMINQQIINELIELRNRILLANGSWLMAQGSRLMVQG